MLARSLGKYKHRFLAGVVEEKAIRILFVAGPESDSVHFLKKKTSKRLHNKQGARQRRVEARTTVSYDQELMHTSNPLHD